MKQILAYVQITVSLFLIVIIILQQKKGGGFFKESGIYQTLRGAEKKIFWATVFLAAIFVFSGLLNLYLK